MEEGDFHTQHIKGNPLYWLGPPLTKGALPAFFFFALCGKRSLLESPLNTVPKLLQENSKDIRIFSLDLPFHKEFVPQKSSMEMWKDSLVKGEDSISPFLEMCHQTIEYLKENGLLTQNSLSVGGISRGGFAALHFAAAISSTKKALLFSPLINPALNKSLEYLSLKNTLPKLLDKTIRIHVGNRDEIVHTSACIHFTNDLVEASYKEGIKPAKIELHLYPSIGYKGHGTTNASFLEGANWLKSCNEAL